MSFPDPSHELFKNLHLKYHAMVLQICLGFMKGDAVQAANLSQEIFINIWNALSKFQGEASYKTSIYRITVNTCLLYSKVPQKKEGLSFQANPLLSGAYYEPIEEHFIALYQAIGQLPELERLIIMLVLDELEYGEISKILGINAIPLRLRIHRIKKKMMMLLNTIEE
jgi:RNA polymerase sigma-70 factor (ECF subfamily)